MRELKQLKNLNLEDKLSTVKNYYIRGAITKKGFIYLLTQITGQKDLEEYINMILDIIENETKIGKKETRKKILKTLVDRM